MKCYTIQIKPSVNGGWETFIVSLDGDRDVRTPQSPHPLGFYHYPATESHRKAFGKLKRLLEKKHIEELDRLQDSLNQLDRLKLPKIHDKKVKP